MMRTMTARVSAALFGLGLALVPTLLLAAEPAGDAEHADEAAGPIFEASGRSLETGADMSMVMWLTVLSLLAIFVLAVLGYAYRQKRQLNWVFQQPDAPHDAHH